MSVEREPKKDSEKSKAFLKKRQERLKSMNKAKKDKKNKGKNKGGFFFFIWW